MDKTEEHNQAYIDGQNLYLGTTKSKDPWKVDLARFRVYLQRKYHVDKAYYFLGYIDDNNQDLYEEIQSAGFILTFRIYGANTISNKKGNVDTDIVFHIMRDFHEKQDKIDKFFLVSGDGDYFRTARYLDQYDKLGKILFPSHKNASSLYKMLNNARVDYLENPGVRNKIELKPR